MNIIPRAGELSFNVLDTASGEPALLFLHYWGGSSPMSIFMGGPAPVRRFLPNLINLVLNEKINPGKVFDQPAERH